MLLYTLINWQYLLHSEKNRFFLSFADITMIYADVIIE